MCVSLVLRPAILGIVLVLPSEVVAAPCVSAITAQHTHAFNTCMAAAHGTRQQLQCIGAEAQLQETREKQAANQVSTRLDPVNRPHFQNAETNWQAYRDSWCTSHASPAWGTSSAINAAVCRMDETIRHSISLETFPRDSVVVECASAGRASR